MANRDWVDHQACSLLQYINVIANLFIIGNYILMNSAEKLLEPTNFFNLYTKSPSLHWKWTGALDKNMQFC